MERSKDKSTIDKPDNDRLVWSFYSKIVGVTFPNDDGTDRQTVIATLRQRDRLHIYQETDNPYDPNAIMVCAPTGQQIGYLKAEVAEEVSDGIQDGYRYLVAVSEVTGGTSGRSLGVIIVLVVADGDATAAQVGAHLDRIGLGSSGLPEGDGNGGPPAKPRPTRTAHLKAPTHKAKGICEGCGKQRVLVKIDSGQHVCRRCHQEIMPPRPKGLASWVEIERLRASGVNVSESLTSADASTLEQGLQYIRTLLLQLWPVLTGGQGFPTDEEPTEARLRQAVVHVLASPVGWQAVKVQASRETVAVVLYKDAYEQAAAEYQAGLRGDHGIDRAGTLCDPHGRRLTYWDFIPDFERDDLFLNLHGVLRQFFPERIPSGR